MPFLSQKSSCALVSPHAPDSPSKCPPQPVCSTPTVLIFLHPTSPPIPQLPQTHSLPGSSIPASPVPVSPHIPPSPIPQFPVSVSPVLSISPNPNLPHTCCPKTHSCLVLQFPPPLFPPISGPCALASPVPVPPHTFSSQSTSPYPPFPCNPISPSPGASVSKTLQLPPAPISPTHSRWLHLTHHFY